MSITVKELLGACRKQVDKGNGDKVVLITSDDEGNAYHTLFCLFTDDMSKIGIPKKYGVPALEKFNAIHGTGFCTAHDIYYGIAEVVFLMQCAGESGVRVTQMEETVARALNVKWQEFDIPGEIKW